MNLDSPVLHGELLAGKYRVEEVLGEGAMGVVVAATHVELGKRVALKFMKLAAISGPEGVERFLREARAAGGLRSEHICHVHDVGRLENGAPYIVMDLLDGEDIQALLKRTGPLASNKVVSFMLEVCEAMDEAHAMGIVHRDLKPQNLFLSRRLNGSEVMKVLDFGVSKMRGAGDLIQTASAAVMGTPAYMSPEQLSSSKNVDPRSDIWSMGVIMYELLLGQLPFNGDEFPQLGMAIVGTSPTPPRHLRPDLDAALESIILRCLEKDRVRRFQSAKELAAALEMLRGEVESRSSLSELAAHPNRSGAVAAASRTTLGAAASQIKPGPRSMVRQSIWLGLGAVVTAALVTGGIATAVSQSKKHAGTSLPPLVGTSSDAGRITAPTIPSMPETPAIPIANPPASETSSATAKAGAKPPLPATKPDAHTNVAKPDRHAKKIRTDDHSVSPPPKPDTNSGTKDEDAFRH